MSGTVSCTALISTSASGAVQCLDGTGTVVPWVAVPDFDFSQLDSATASGAFAAGFVLVGIGWAIGRAFGVVLSMFK
ncbi:MAG TPA: hypothetical protein VHW71_04220 [Steroidobacteraceae bacterium]|nr:hypothetical protein [Steroidobacteraceae bacterium]